MEGVARFENKNVPIGTQWLVDKVFDALMLDDCLDGTKRVQGPSTAAIIRCLVAYGMQSNGLSVLELSEIENDRGLREFYGLPREADSNQIYRTIKRLGRKRHEIMRHILRVLRNRYHIPMDCLFVDWSTSYIDGKATLNIRFGHSKDHRPDRPQVAYGIALDKATGIPLGLTVRRGNINDNPHFRTMFGLLRGFLPKGAEFVFDAGANGKINKTMLNDNGFHFLTRVNINTSDMKYLELNRPGWLYLLDGTFAFRFQGNLGYDKTLYYSEKRREETFQNYRRKAEHDYDEMMEIMKSQTEGKGLRKKYRNSNYYVDTTLQVKPEFEGMAREDAILAAVESRKTGTEGYFILISNMKLNEQQTLDLYRERHKSEDGFKDLKSGLRIRPLRSKNWYALTGRIMLAYLGLLVLYFAKFMTPSIRNHTAETLINRLREFSLTVLYEDGSEKGRFYCNSNPIVDAIDESFQGIPLCKRKDSIDK